MRQDVVPGTTAEAVYVTDGTGRGHARLTAFDAALQDAGIHDANLIRVSSITPATADVHQPATTDLRDRIEPGAYYPTVYAWKASQSAGERVHAAVAGARLDSGYGVNVEHHGVDTTESSVRRACEDMLEEMAGRREARIVDSWVRYTATTVPADGTWASAVAAILYGD